MIKRQSVRLVRAVRVLLGLGCGLGIVLGGGFAGRAEDFPAPKNTQPGAETLLTPQEALGRIRAPDGFQVSLFAGALSTAA